MHSVKIYKDMPEPEEFQRRSDESPEEALRRFLVPYGFDYNEKVPLSEKEGSEGKVDIKALIEMLPERIPQGVNAAHRELRDYYEAIPYVRRSGGIYIWPEDVLALLMQRLEFFRGIADGLVRNCTGPQCGHYDVCPFKHVAEDVVPQDDVECMVDRQVIQNTVNEFVDPEDGSPKVDPRRPAQALLFEQLVQLLVKERRVSMHLQNHPVLVDHWEILKDGEIETFESMNQTVHPLLETWDRLHTRIESTLKQLGISPEFEMRQGLWIDESDQLSSEQRAREMLPGFIKNAAQNALQEFPEGSPERKAMERMLQIAEKQAEDQKSNQLNS